MGRAKGGESSRGACREISELVSVSRKGIEESVTWVF